MLLTNSKSNRSAIILEQLSAANNSCVFKSIVSRVLPLQIHLQENHWLETSNTFLKLILEVIFKDFQGGSFLKQTNKQKNKQIQKKIIKIKEKQKKQTFYCMLPNETFSLPTLNICKKEVNLKNKT